MNLESVTSKKQVSQIAEVTCISTMEAISINEEDAVSCNTDANIESQRIIHEEESLEEVAAISMNKDETTTGEEDIVLSDVYSDVDSNTIIHEQTDEQTDELQRIENDETTK